MVWYAIIVKMSFTRVDEKLIGQSGMVDVVYCSREKSGGDFQWSENALKK